MKLLLILILLPVLGWAQTKSDTIKVNMLCTSDAVYYYLNSENAINNIQKVFPSFKLDGYEVKEYDYSLARGDGTSQVVYKHKEYLDSDKKPLQKSIIVWQTK